MPHQRVDGNIALSALRKQEREKVVDSWCRDFSDNAAIDDERLRPHFRYFVRIRGPHELRKPIDCLHCLVRVSEFQMQQRLQRRLRSLLFFGCVLRNSVHHFEEIGKTIRPLRHVEQVEDGGNNAPARCMFFRRVDSADRCRVCLREIARHSNRGMRPGRQDPAQEPIKTRFVRQSCRLGSDSTRIGRKNFLFKQRADTRWRKRRQRLRRLHCTGTTCRQQHSDAQNRFDKVDHGSPENHERFGSGRRYQSVFFSRESTQRVQGNHELDSRPFCDLCVLSWLSIENDP